MGRLIPSLRVVGLTGGIGSGKSTVARFVASHGIPVIDLDALVHGLFVSDDVLVDAIVARFGHEVRAAGEGGIDRRRLGALVFGDVSARQDLEALVHPAVIRGMIAALEELARGGEELAVVEIPLLFEAGMEAMVDVVVVATAPEATRRARVGQRDGLDAVEVAARIAAQLPLEDKVARADMVVDTSGTFDDVAARVQALVPRLRSPSERE